MRGPVFPILMTALVLALPATAGAMEVWVAAPGTSAPDTLVASFGLRDILDPDEENPTLGEGMPAELVETVLLAGSTPSKPRTESRTR